MSHRKVEVPEGDVLIHAGDALSHGTEKEFWPFSVWMAHLSHPLKIYVPGNHDFFVQENQDVARQLLKEGRVHMLVDKAIRYEGVKFVGSPWVPNLEGWAYYGDHLTLLRRFNAIPKNTQILITHCPPAGVCDEVSRSHVGSNELLDAIQSMNELRLHVFGHIHEGYGVQKIGNVQYVNAAINTREYKPTNKPIVVDI